MPIIMEYSKVKKEWPEFMDVLRDTREKASSDAKLAWGLEDGGFYPTSGQFGECGIRPRFVQIGTTTGRESWLRAYATAGWNTVIDNNVIEDVYLGIVGFVLPNAVQNALLVRIEAGDAKLPVIQLEGEVDVMEEPIVVFDKGLVVPEDTSVKLEVYARQQCHQTIKPFGFALAKQKVLIDKDPT